MEEPPAKETPAPGLNKIDLSQLQDFHFGTQWTEVKSAPGPRREREPGREGPERGDSRPREGAAGEPRRDRRGFRRPAGAPADQPPGSPGGRPPFGREDADRPAGERRRESGPRSGRPPRREEGGERRWSGPRPPEQRPYLSPFFNVAFYPEDAGFAALVKAMRASCRTFELFEIARLILGKVDRFVVVLTRQPPETPAPAGAPEAPASDDAAAAPPSRPAPAAGPIHVSLPDGMPFETEDAAIAHVLHHHLGRFFDLATVTVDPPKGTFPFVNRCTLSGELLGPPNYHRYQQIVQQHHATRFARMPFERFREHIETVRDPAVVSQWLEKMKQVTRYTWKPLAEGEPAPVFDDLDDARAHLLASAKTRMVKAVESARCHAKVIESLPPGEIRRAIDGQLERQRRFPLDTANALRGRLRREGFTIFKKGAKGVSYVCAVKRKFRVPGQSFAAGINTLITFLEANPMITVKELPVKLLGITPLPAGSTPPMPALSMSTPPMAVSTSPVPPPATEPAAPAGAAPGESVASVPVESAAVPAEPAAVPVAAEPAVSAVPAAPPEAPPPPMLTPEEQERLRRLTMDLRWLVTEGYVTEFADGRLFAPPPMIESRSRQPEAPEGEEHDLESFPEAPDAAEPAAEMPAAPPAETGTEPMAPAPRESAPATPPASAAAADEAPPAPTSAPADPPDPPAAATESPPPVAESGAPTPVPAAEPPPA